MRPFPSAARVVFTPGAVDREQQCPPSLDEVPVGLAKIVEGGVVGWVNDAFLVMFRRDRADVVGRRFVELLAPEDGDRIADRYEKRLRGVQVPTEYESGVLRGDGTLAVVQVHVSRRDGGVMLVAVRDVTHTVRRRELRRELAQLGTALYRERTEARVDFALRRGARLQRLGVTWLYVDPAAGRMRVRYADLPAEARAAGAPADLRLDGMEGPWSPTVRAAWEVGEAYSDAVQWEFARFAAATRGAEAPAGDGDAETLRGVAVRLFDEGEPSVLVFLGEWLREDDAVLLRQCVAQLVLALSNARDRERAERRERDLQSVNALARKVLGATQSSVDEMLRTGALALGDALSMPAVRALRIDPARRVARDVTSEPSSAVPLGDEAPTLSALADPAAELVPGRDPRVAALAARGLVGDATRVIPLVARGRVEGAVCLDDARPLVRDEHLLVRAMASVVQVGMENAALYDELREGMAELQSTQERMVQRERLAALGELAAVVAHEVRNPLAVMFNALSTLDRQLRLEGDPRVLFTLLKEEAERLNRIVGDLQDFVRPMTLRLAPLDVASLIEPSLHAAEAVIPHAATRVRVSRGVEEPVPRVLADDRLLRQALVNLLVNGFQAMPQGGSLTVRLRPAHEPGHGVALEIGDTGVGITEENRARIFEPFYTTKATGTGLGLAVVKRIVEQHGGSVSVHSALGRGTTFVVWLPARPDA